MPAKYVIHTKPVKPRYRPVGKLGIVDWREDCSGCHNCVKRSCVYNLYRDENQELHSSREFLDYIYQCNGCLVCVQECTKNILTRVTNPEYNMLGNEYYTPEIILSTWYQSETGGIPVSGAGYGGKFTGSGFNGMWTDMSEIVRPTRDGIHGREYINTSVDIGRKLNHLSFRDNDFCLQTPPRLEIPVPLLFDVLPEYFYRGDVLSALCRAATQLHTYAIVKESPFAVKAAGTYNIIPLQHAAGKVNAAFKQLPFVLLPYNENIMTEIRNLKAANPGQIMGVRMQAVPGAAERIVCLTAEGAEVINLVFDEHGREAGGPGARHMRDVIREVHTRLIKEGIRDEVTLVVSGGIALPEYMAKAIICGADLVTIDLALMVALECRLCRECSRDGRCPVKLEEIDKEYAVKRIINLTAAWRNQLLEMLGAMGIREVKRLRGETGRCMFFEDLEKETFAPLFGKRKENIGS